MISIVFLTEAEVTCPVDYFQCLTTHICIPNNWKCDKQSDCGYGDNSDEVDCHYQCLPNEMACDAQNFTCIEMDHYCDGFKDCMDGRDEPTGDDGGISCKDGV